MRRKVPLLPVFDTFSPVPDAKKPDDRQFKVGDKIRVNLHHGKIEDAVVKAVVQDDDGIIKSRTCPYWKLHPLIDRAASCLATFRLHREISMSSREIEGCACQNGRLAATLDSTPAGSVWSTNWP